PRCSRSQHERRLSPLSSLPLGKGASAALTAACTGLSPSQYAHEGHQIALLLRGELEFQDQIEEFDRIFQRQTPAVMKVRRTLLDTAQRKRLDRPQGSFVDKTLDAEIVHLVIQVEWRSMAGGALPLPKEDLFAAPFALGGLGGIQPPLRRQFR